MATKITLVIDKMGRGGGAQRVIGLWANWLAAAGYDVTLITYYALPDEYPLHPGVKRLNIYDSYAQYKSKKIHRRKRHHAFRVSAKRIQFMENFLQQNPQDVVIPFLADANVICSLMAQTNVKAVTQTVRNSPWKKPQFPIERLCHDAIIRQGTVILQNAEQQIYFRRRRFRHVKTYLVHNPLNPDIINLGKSTYRPIQRLIAVGRLHPQKNYPLMIKVIRILRDRYHFPCTLDIYGVGQEQTAVQNLINRYHLQNQITLRGKIPNIFETVQNYDLFLMTSLYEGTPNALLEAMGLGVPCLATAFRTGAHELINDGINGWLAPSYRADRIAQKILQINDPALLERVGRQARTDMQRYLPEHCFQELKAVLNDLLA